jgi:hypothetical protein
MCYKTKAEQRALIKVSYIKCGNAEQLRTSVEFSNKIIARRYGVLGI